MSETPKHILTKIQRVKKEQLKELNLRGNDLTEVPAEIFELKQLAILNLSQNSLTTTPSSIMHSRLKCTATPASRRCSKQLSASWSNNGNEENGLAHRSTRKNTVL
jgi:Leucine-rich repeat (LRR) protein